MPSSISTSPPPRGIAAFAAERDYQRDGSGYRYEQIELALEAVIAGQAKDIDLLFETHDFAGHFLPTVFQLTDQPSPRGSFAGLEVDFEWDTDAVSVEQEVAGWSGQFQLEQDSGTADARGLRGDGLIGGFLVAEKGADRLTVSFSAPVVGYDIDD